MKRSTFMFLLALLLVVPTATRASADSPSSSVGILPAAAKPHGVSRTDMAQTVALFESSLNAGTPIAPPSTPFQILDLNHLNYVVTRNTVLYVPVFNFDDSPPVTGCTPPGVPGTPGCVGVWPANHKAALSYIYGAQKVGGHDMAITIDGRKTALSQDYLAGPVSTPPLLDGGGTHELLIAAYVGPLAVGTHTVRITGVLDGPYLEITYGVSSFPADITYTVNVTP
jgi:hypothetical protein